MIHRACMKVTPASVLDRGLVPSGHQLSCSYCSGGAGGGAMIHRGIHMGGFTPACRCCKEVGGRGDARNRGMQMRNTRVSA
jgi:hypothetical protein